MKKSSLLSVVCICALTSFSSSSNAFFFEIYYDEIIDGTPPDSLTQWATLSFNDVSPGAVEMIFSVSNNLAPTTAGIDEYFFSLDSILDPGLLTFTFNQSKSTISEPQILTGVNLFDTPGGGSYDFSIRTIPSTARAGDTISMLIGYSGAGPYSAGSFNTPSEGAGGGVFIAAAHMTGTGDGTGEAFIAGSVVPIPAAVWLFGSGLLGLIGFARKKAA
jgi:hypothetical protein